MTLIKKCLDEVIVCCSILQCSYLIKHNSYFRRDNLLHLVKLMVKVLLINNFSS